MIEKIARKPSSDPAQEKLRQDKATWNKQVSMFLNDVIHLKKMMNGWPSKFFKERSRITAPIPADPNTIIGSLANDFQELAQRGQSIVEQQLNYSKARRQKQIKAPVAPATETPGGQAPPAETSPPSGDDLSKQLAAWEVKYELISEASNPFTRLITRLITPTIGFGEAARIRRLRMSLLSACVKSYKELKKLHKEIVKSSKGSILSSHKIMNSVWNHWTIVARSFAAFKSVRPGPVVDAGGEIEVPETKEEKSEKEEREQQKSLEENNTSGNSPTDQLLPSVDVKPIIQDYRSILSKVRFPNDPIFVDFNALLGKYYMVPAPLKLQWISSIVQEYKKIIDQLNAKYGTNGTTLTQIADLRDAKNKSQLVVPPVTASLENLLIEAQLGKWLGKTRHELLPGDTSSSRLEIYRLISNLKMDLDGIMDILQKGFDVEQLTPIIAQVNRQITSLRAMVRSLHYSEKPEDAVQTSFF